MARIDTMQAVGLDDPLVRAPVAAVMKRNAITIGLVAAAALAGCNKENHTIVAGDTNDSNVVTNAAVVLPPSIAASKTYRCGDNSVVFVDWLSDNKSANVRTEATGSATSVVAAEPGKPLTGGGYSLTGSATGSSITVSRPGHGSQTCNV
jgi:hypothetical protein